MGCVPGRLASSISISSSSSSSGGSQSCSCDGVLVPEDALDIRIEGRGAPATASGSVGWEMAF